LIRIKTIVFILFFLPVVIQAQSIQEEMATRICECIDEEVSNFDTLNQMIDTCSTRIIVATLSDSTLGYYKNINSVEDLQYILFSTRMSLFQVCPQVRHNVLIYRRTKFYTPPSSQAGNYYFELGAVLYEMEEYGLASAYFKLADKSEKKKPVVYDFMGMCYYRQNQTDLAIKFFTKSLKYFADSDIALLQLAKIYFDKGDYMRSKTYYERFQYLYPESPDAYFGLARIALQYNHPDNAAESGLIAYTLYKQLNYDEDLEACTELLHDIYLELEKINKSFIFKKIIKDYELDIPDEPWLKANKFSK